MVSKNKEEELSVVDFIDLATKLLIKSKTLFRIRIEGETTNIIIDKPKEDKKKIEK